MHKLKAATPNLRVINLYGINFIDDSHIDAFSSNCIQLECLAVNYCNKVTGSTLKTLFQRSKRLKCLLMNGTSLQSEYVMSVEWDKTWVEQLLLLNLLLKSLLLFVASSKNLTSPPLTCHPNVSSTCWLASPTWSSWAPVKLTVSTTPCWRLGWSRELAVHSPP